MGFDHEKHAKYHAKDQARLRHGVVPTAMEMEDLRCQVVQGRATLIEDQFNRGVYQVDFRGQKVEIVYHRWKNQVVTFLPRNSLQLQNYLKRQAAAPPEA